MKSSVAGIPLHAFGDPIYDALSRYTELTGGRVTFDSAAARQLMLTPKSEKPNSARSATLVRYLGKVAGQLFVIVFAPGDGTGDESAHRLSALDTDIYPRDAKIVPRSKAAAHSEVHLTVAAFRADETNTDPVLFAGNQQLLGLDRKSTIVRIGELGQTQAHFQRIFADKELALPTATLTVGYDASGERFGDPHAVYNAHPEAVQVCGFIAISPEAAAQHLEMLNHLRAVEPRPL